MAKKYDGFENFDTRQLWVRIENDEALYLKVEKLTEQFRKEKKHLRTRRLAKALRNLLPEDSNNKKIKFNQIVFRLYLEELENFWKTPQKKPVIIKDEKYNGWSNRETWALYLQLSNDYDLYHSIKKLSETAKSFYDFSDLLKDHVMEFETEALHKPTVKLLSLLFDVGSLWRVDFDEVAKAFWSE